MRKNNITQRLGGIFLVITLLFFLGSCKKDSSSPGANEVFIENMSFSPSTITVTVNTTVTWINNDGMSHTVTSLTDLFDSGSISDGKAFSYTFTSAGTFNYNCTIHPSMTGSVVVTAK